MSLAAEPIDRCTGMHAIFVLNLPVPDDRRVWQQACAIRDSGRPVAVFCPALRGHRPGRRMVDGIEVVYLRTFEAAGSVGLAVEGLWNTFLSLVQLIRLRRWSASTVQVCNPPDTLFLLLSACRRMGMGTIYDQHDVVPAMASTRAALARIRWLFEWCERATVRSADIVLTSSRTQRDRLLDEYGVEAELVRSPTVATSRRRSTDTRPGCHLGNLGVIGAQDGLADFLDALVAVRRRGVDFTVTIAGDGPALGAVRRHAESLELTDAVSFPGWLQGAELQSFLGSIDAMVVSDPESEYNHFCAMNKVIEAMASGIPLIMRPLRENELLTGSHRWIASGWTPEDLAEVIVDFARAPVGVRVGVGQELADRYDDVARWNVQRRRYVLAVGSTLG